MQGISSLLCLFCFADHDASSLELEPSVVLMFSLTTLRIQVLLRLKISEVTNMAVLTVLKTQCGVEKG